VTLNGLPIVAVAIVFDINSSVFLYEKNMFQESLIVLDSLMKKDTVHNVECLLIVINKIKLKDFYGAKRFIDSCNNYHIRVSENCLLILNKLKKLIDIAVENGDVYSLNSSADFFYTMRDSISEIDRYLRADSTAVNVVTFIK